MDRIVHCAGLAYGMTKNLTMKKEYYSDLTKFKLEWNKVDTKSLLFTRLFRRPHTFLFCKTYNSSNL